MELDYDSLYVGGEWITPASSSKITVVSAGTEQVIGHVPEAVEADVDAAVGAARRAFDDPNGWAHWEPAQRAAAMERLASALDKRAGEMVRRISSQNGMPVAVANQLEAVFPALLLRYYAGLVNDDTFEEIRPGLLGGTTLVRREPLGVVGAIVPWNFPQTLAFMKLAPALAAGCTVVLKPSSETVLDSFLLAEAIAEAELPAGVVNIVPGGRGTGAYLVSHPQVDKIAFTGSTQAGRAIAETCGRLLRPVTLELGGKSAGIVLDDADLDLAKIAQQMFTATLLNNGQTCFLSTRVLAPRSRYGEIVDIFSGLAGALKVGDPLDPSTQVGPMVSERQRERVEGYIAKGKSEGARITVGGGRPKGLDKGWFVEPTVFADVDNSHTVAQEEIFGPVLSVIPYSDVDEAVSIANASDFGLGGTVWTADHGRGVEVAKRVQTGSIGINNYLPDPTAPFGGVKSSGMGRELGPEGLAAYLNFKSIYLPVKLQPVSPQPVAQVLPQCGLHRRRILMEVTAAVLREVGGDFGLEKVRLEAPRPGEVLVQISAVGICHTDLATRDGALPFPLPGVLGHEGAGVVVEVGEGVTKVAPGDRVGMSFASCGSCPACSSDVPAYCHRFMELNYAGVRTSDGSSPLSNAQGPVGSSFFGQSSFATHAITGERNVVKVGSDIPLHLVAPLGCGVQTGAGAIMRSFAAPAGSSVLILGAGSVGLSAVLGAVVQGCGHIIVVEPIAARRELAVRLGAAHTIDPAAGAVSEQVRGLLPQGVNFALDTTGHAGVLAEAVQCLGNQGTLGMLGVPSDPDAVLSLPLIQSLVLGLTVKAIVEGDSDPDAFIPQLIELYEAGKFPFDELITTMPFSKINDGVAMQHSGQAVKVVLVHDTDQ